MVTIQELKAVEMARQTILKRLMEQPLSEYQFVSEDRPHLRALGRVGWVESIEIKSDEWFWLTEAGWHRLGYEKPEHYGDPTCEECLGSGRDLWFDDDGDDVVCDICDGSGVNIVLVDEFILRDEDQP